MRRFITIPLAAAAVLIGLTACSAGPSAGSVAVTENTVIIDVRTAQEQASGVLEGAKQLDFNSGELVSALPSLDPNAEYLVYCRSGNRAGQAIKMMEEAGFTQVTNLGSLEQAAQATGLPVVK